MEINRNREASRKEWFKVTNAMKRADLKTSRKEVGG